MLLPTVCSFQDGGKFLADTLWEHKFRYEYAFHMGLDHVGPGTVARTLEAYAFLGKHMREAIEPPAPPTEDELAAKAGFDWMLSHGFAPPEGESPPEGARLPNFEDQCMLDAFRSMMPEVDRAAMADPQGSKYARKADAEPMIK